jgi:hypothetical protein
VTGDEDGTTVTPEERGPEPAEQVGVAPAVDTTRLRELVLRAHPEAIPELVQGETLEELEASATLATEVYRRIAASVREAVAREAAASIPAGQPGRQASLVDLEALSPTAKIAEGLRRARDEETWLGERRKGD